MIVTLRAHGLVIRGYHDEVEPAVLGLGFEVLIPSGKDSAALSR
jgi:hypothetical protein